MGLGSGLGRIKFGWVGSDRVGMGWVGSRCFGLYNHRVNQKSYVGKAVNTKLIVNGTS